MKLKEVKHIEDNKIGIKEGFLKAMRIKTAHELLFEKGFNLVREDITTVVYREKSGKEKKELKLNKTEKISFVRVDYFGERMILNMINRKDKWELAISESTMEMAEHAPMGSFIF